MATPAGRSRQRAQSPASDRRAGGVGEEVRLPLGLGPVHSWKPLAGMMQRRSLKASRNILSCTIIVREADEWMERYHDRMPVVLEEKDFDAWLNGLLSAEVFTCAAESALRE